VEFVTDHHIDHVVLDREALRTHRSRLGYRTWLYVTMSCFQSHLTKNATTKWSTLVRWDPILKFFLLVIRL